MRERRLWQTARRGGRDGINIRRAPGIDLVTVTAHPRRRVLCENPENVGHLSGASRAHGKQRDDEDQVSHEGSSLVRDVGGLETSAWSWHLVAEGAARQAIDLAF